jgi:ubiquinone/menaquinone biosynthesis C-methylase UbiE
VSEQRLIQKIRPSAKDNFLDIGGGGGEFAETLSKYCAEVFVIDPK